MSSASRRPSREPSSNEQRLPELNSNTSPEDLLKLAYHFQADKNAAQAELNLVRRKYDDIIDNNDDQEQPSSKRTKRAQQSDDNEDNDVRSKSSQVDVTQAGHKFSLIHCPWLRHGEELFSIDFKDDYSAEERFENDDNLEQGQLHEVWDLLKDKYEKDVLKQKWAPRAFVAGLNTQKWNTASRLRHDCASIFKVSEIDFLNPLKRKELFRTRIGWVDDNGGSYSPVDVEILHKDYRGEYSLQSIFLNPILMGVYIALIRGPTAGKKFTATREFYFPMNETMAKIHGIRNITPGAIATTAILARWALSADDSLQEVGSSTQINYLQDYEEYLKILDVGLRRRKKSVMNIFREWDANIFPYTDSSLAGKRQGPSNRNSGLRRVMEVLDQDESEEEDELADEDDGRGAAAAAGDEGQTE